MSVDKVTISIESGLLRKLDRLVEERVYPSRSRAIQDAVAEKVRKFDRSRLERELAKLDITEEQALADLGMKEDLS